MNITQNKEQRQLPVYFNILGGGLTRWHDSQQAYWDSQRKFWILVPRGSAFLLCGEFTPAEALKFYPEAFEPQTVRFFSL